MQNKIVLISDDSDFFDYIIPKLSLRKSDEVFRFGFYELPDKVHLLKSSLLIINSENHYEQTLELLDIVNDVPIIVFSYNDDEKFKIEAYKKGMYAYFTLSTSNEEINAKLRPALKLILLIEKSAMYRDILVRNNIVSKNNEVFFDFTNILEHEINDIKKNSSNAVLLAISPNNEAKYTVQPNLLETIILNNIRKNDILMNFSHNKYFLLLNNTNLDKAEKICNKLLKKLPEGIYTGLAVVGNKSRQQLVNEVLNKLHTAMSGDKSDAEFMQNEKINNFKFFKDELYNKISKIVSPVFYHIQQKYNDKLFGIKIEQGIGEGYGVLYLVTDSYMAELRITSPGFTTINIDMSYHKTGNDTKYINIDNKRITIELEELESGLLNDLIEEFIKEFKYAVENI